MAQKGNSEVLKLMSSRMEELNEDEATSRLKLYGLNEVASEKRLSWLMHLINNMKNPLVILLTVLAIISYSTGDIRATVEKDAAVASKDIKNPLEISNLCFLGSNVVSGTALAVTINTGGKTYFGSVATSLVGTKEMTSFDKGINGFTWLMIRFIAVMVPLVFVVNGLSKNNWLEAFLFAMAVAVGLTPEMMPMIVSVNLSKGALVMSKKKIIKSLYHLRW